MGRMMTNSIQSDENTSTSSGKQDRKVMILLIIIIALVLVFGVLFFWMYNKLNVQNNSAQGLVLDTSATAMKQHKDIGNVVLAGYDDISLAVGGSVSLQNPEANKSSDLYVKYEIVDNDTEKVIYESDLIAAGSEVIWVPSDDLKPGQYNISFIQRPFYVENGEYVPTMAAGKNDIVLTIN